MDAWNRLLPCFLCHRHQCFNMHFTLTVKCNLPFTIYSHVENEIDIPKLIQFAYSIFCSYIKNEIFDLYFKDHAFNKSRNILLCNLIFLKKWQNCNTKNYFSFKYKKKIFQPRFPICFHCRLERQKVYWFQTLVGVGLC